MDKSYSIENIENELSVINFENMDSTAEVKLAAEIGQLLLERNKALESTLERNQQIITQQQAEIDKLAKQAQYFQTANDSSLKVSEQLEQTLLELEKSNKALMKQRSVDMDMLKELKERKAFLELRCENLEESYEYIEEKLTMAQTKINVCERIPVVAQSVSSDSVIEIELEPVPDPVPSQEEKLSKRLEHLTTDLCDTKCEIAMYHERMEKLESQLTLLLQKNMELEDVIASRRFPPKSRTTTSGCSSEKQKNCTSLAEEMEAVEPAKMSRSLESFADGFFLTSTPPKINKSPKRQLIGEPDTTIDIPSDEVNVDCLSADERRQREQRNKLKRAAYLKRQLCAVSSAIEDKAEQKVRINVTIEINPDEDRIVESSLCRRHRLKCFARTIVLAYKDTLVNGLCKIFGPIVNQPRNYLGTLLLWSNKQWIEDNIRIM